MVPELGDVVPNHVISTTDVPAEFGRNALRCKPLEMIQVECIARGYLAGLGLREYQKHGTVSGVPLPAGLVEGSKLPEPIFTPTTKISDTGHDEFITFDDVVDQVGRETAEQLRDLTIEIYQRGAARAEQTGIIIADTKFEFGRDADGTLTLGDEVLTSDSSRFWPADQWKPGGPQFAFDKQFVRDWSSTLEWDRTPPGPEVPADIVEATRQRYTDVYERITGETWTPGARHDRSMGHLPSRQARQRRRPTPPGTRRDAPTGRRPRGRTNSGSPQTLVQPRRHPHALT
ncbi:phosphoribosylaminoimidazolesuccinocarboxamide synthase [Saccharopolyspora gregorii]|uniref:phosphoribosylaminoimidazolesuccinocarboxamide synthase n=1 Tax=Saccharopolyspora gregorii TaxID=33914 RepID=A0ABP6RK61_9PSEU